MALEFVFRVDSSNMMGAGHVMRCLTLALRISRMGGNCTFVCRDHGGNVYDKIQLAGFEVKLLPRSNDYSDSNWLGADAIKDASEFSDVIEGISPDWVVVDHYAIDEEWEATVSGRLSSAKILVIDDLADRKHVCDFLLDLSPGRAEADYSGLTEADAKLLIGLNYALLRPDYLRLRREMGVPRTQVSDRPKILVTFGGGDHSGILHETLAGMQALLEKYQFDLLVQGDLSNISIPESLLDRIEHREFVSDMALEIASSDLMICAAGGTSWERCSLGKPAVVLTVAENQQLNTEAISKAGAGICVGGHSVEIAEAVEALLTDPQLYSNISINSWNLCDGRGVNRVCNLMFSEQMELTPATMEDARFIYDARYSSGAAEFYKNPVVPVFEDHENWMTQALDNRTYFLGCVLVDGVKIAHVRFDFDAKDDARAEIGIALAEMSRGKGLAAAILLRAIEQAKATGITHLDAEIHMQNAASISAFEQAGFLRTEKTSSPFLHYEIDLKE